MAAVHDLPANLRGAAAEANAAEVGGSRAAGSGDAVAAQAAFGLEGRGATRPGVEIGGEPSREHESEQH